MTDIKCRILVIGAGFSGLTTAYTLAKNGYHVTVLYKASSGIVSEVAAALWVLPMPSASWKDRQTAELLQKWAMSTYKRLSSIAASDKGAGVHMKDMCYVFSTKISDSAVNSAYMNSMRSIPGFRHSHNILSEREELVMDITYHTSSNNLTDASIVRISKTNVSCINSPGLVDCFSYTSPFVDPDVYLKWLTRKCQSLGVRFQQGTITGLLKEKVESLKRQFDVDLVVNCTGIASRELADDKDVYPLTGVAIICKRHDKSLPDFGIDCITHWHDDEFKTQGHVIILPRGSLPDRLWIGSLVSEIPPSEMHMHHPVIQRMLSECCMIYPPLKQLMMGQEITLKVGARPARKGSPRVERDSGCQSLIHNYGHGSYGCIMAWGSAEEVLKIVQNSKPIIAAKL